MTNDEFRLRQVRAMLWQLNQDSQDGEPTLTMVTDLNSILRPVGLRVEYLEVKNAPPCYLLALLEKEENA